MGGAAGRGAPAAGGGEADGGGLFEGFRSVGGARLEQDESRPSEDGACPTVSVAFPDGARYTYKAGTTVKHVQRDLLSSGACPPHQAPALFAARRENALDVDFKLGESVLLENGDAAGAEPTAVGADESELG